MAREIEAKIALGPGELDRLRERLIEAGAEPGPVDDEQNLRFDFDDGRLRRTRRSLRLRTYAGRCEAVLTCKKPAPERSAYKSKDEFELSVENAGAALIFLEQLGLRPTVTYAKRREYWYLNQVVITLDSLEFGDFIEVEGAEPDIRNALELIGLRDRAPEQASYARLASRTRKLARV